MIYIYSVQEKGTDRMREEFFTPDDSYEVLLEIIFLPEETN